MDYFVGVDALGAEDGDYEVLGAANPQGPFLVIHVKNIPELVKKKGGSAGAAAFSLVPQTIENKVYSEMASEFGPKLKEQGVDADIQIVTTKPAGGPLSSDFLFGSLAGASLVGVGVGLIKLTQYLTRR